MAHIGLWSTAEKERRELALAIEELGHRVSQVIAVKDALELVGQQAPSVMVVETDEGDRNAETFLAEVEAIRPFLPVLVALRKRDATRAVDLMRAGAYEVVSPPWTRENIGACLAKALRTQGTVISPAPIRREPRDYLTFVAAVAIFVAAAVGYSVVQHRERLIELSKKAPPTDWELPYYHPAGMACTSKEVWIADWFSQTIYRHDPETLAVRRSLHLPRMATLTAIALTADSMWIASSNGALSKHMLTDQLQALIKRKVDSTNIVGLAYDGLYLWTLDGKQRRFTRHLLDDQLSPLASFDYPGIQPAALTYDGRSLWSIDSANRELIEHPVDDPHRVVYKATLTEYHSGRWRPTGLCWDGKAFLSVGEGMADTTAGHVFLHKVVKK